MKLPIPEDRPGRRRHEVDRTSLDGTFMKEALRMARTAGRRGEVPVGSVAVLDDRMVARGGNSTLSRNDPTAHAEVVALRRCARRVGNHRLSGVVLYVTLEPCLMCLGAMVQARIARCVYGAADPKVGAARLLGLPALRRGLNHRFEISGGVEAEACSDLLRLFFRERRTGR
jgi:tRNA(adenine34) deaminase